ncbi:MAG: hypothetical protein FJ276_26565 [Planctomycetes bacterium]|nr:hypothetical protein [Planctomycetota bacterium]
MRLLTQILSWLALAGTILPSVLYATGQLELETCKWIMVVATVVWFVATPFWMGRPRGDAALDVS